jgi:uncharacterized pyridoxal phosphate-containing UPF0001 family protein
MGMSDDFRVAVEEGATSVRIGAPSLGISPNNNRLDAFIPLC